MNALAPIAEGTEAPAAYAAFVPVFERLSEPLQQILYGQLAQFERLAARLGAQEFAQHGEFEGLGGLVLRGDLAQIVQSELLLRTEAPMEFLRRLAEAETLFYEKQYADPGARSVYRAMVSVGPGLLGHGRIVALAALFFMARIARAQGAAFHWCFLPRKEGAVWFDELSINTIKRMLRAASYREATVDDAAEAAGLWSELALGDRPSGKLEPLDWIIGAGRRDPVRDGKRSGRAVDNAANVLAFTLQSPHRGQPRAVQVLLQKHGREATRTTIQFPDDRVCVSALKNPFRPLVAAPGPTGASTRRPPRAGWAEEYFVIPATNAKIVRMREGLLILTFSGPSHINGRWFVPLGPELQLVGVKLNQNMLSIMVHDGSRPNGALIYRSFGVFGGGKYNSVINRSCELVAEHLFRKHPPYALPTLFMNEGVRFFSSSGHAFQLDAGSGGLKTTFTPLYNEPKVVCSSGTYSVVRIVKPEGVILRVLRPGGGMVGEYNEGSEPATLDRLHGMNYSRSQRSLSYSLSPNSWLIPAPRLDRKGRPWSATERPADGSFSVEPCELLLAGRLTHGVTSARVWSDARYGGDGQVRSIVRRNGESAVKQPVLDLGEDALAIVRVEVGDDGVWAVTVDADGDPAQLRVYRSARKRSGQFECATYDLAAERDQATEIDLERGHG